MKRTRKSILILISLTFTMTVLGQSIDEKRMERDLKVAENILSTLTNGDVGSRYHSRIESNYMPGFGVVFSIPKLAYSFSTLSSSSVIYEGTSQAYVISIDDEEGEDDEKDEEDEKAEDYRRRKQNKRELIARQEEEYLQKNLTAFLVDYADLIGQIKPSERIVVQTRNGNSRISFSGGQLKSKQNTFTAYILKSDLIAYKKGKLNRENLVEKVVIKRPDENEASKDIELFATIFARLYESDLSSTYYLSSRNIGYTSLDGFGVTFNMKVYSSSSSGGLHTIHTTGESGLSKEERNEKVNAMYPQFEQTLKENIMDYGRTIKSLKPEEILVMNVALTECIGCEMPKELEVSVKGKVLQSYDKGSISRDEGIKQMNIKKKD